MILNEEEIIEILEKPRNENILKWKEDHKVLDIYTNGGDVVSEIAKIRGFENDIQKSLREKITKSTKDKVSDLLHPITKIFNSNGGSRDFGTLSSAEKSKFLPAIDKIPEGISVRKWMEIYWKEAFVSDPNSIILIEIKDNASYPTYKSINVIHDYITTWDKLEYLVLIHEEEDEDGDALFRIIDDEKDNIYKLKTERSGSENKTELVLIDEIIHHNGFVPAIICGGEPDRHGGKKSFIEKIDESLRSYLRSSSVFEIYKFLHLFPTFWRYAMKCTKCNGSGTIDNPRYNPKDDKSPSKITCSSCNGKRIKINRDVSDGISLPIPTHDQPVLAPDIAGYIEPPIGTWKQMKEDLRDQRKEMEYTLWGAHLEKSQDNKERTATEVYIDKQPVNERLYNVSRFAESKESKVLSFMAVLMFGKEFRIRTYYGKRFVVESPDVVWQKYVEARQKQAPITTLDYLYEQYLMSEFQNDMTMFYEKRALFYAEPFPHYSLHDIIKTKIKKDIAKKVMFADWVKTIDVKKHVNPDGTSNISELFNNYFKLNYHEESKESETIE